MNDFVIRKNIIEKLEKNRAKPLSLITAPAGYGKSVTVSEWLENTKALHVWISLDEEHNQLSVFLQYLITALENIFPGTFIETGIIIKRNELPSIQIIALALINELDLIKQDFILVLDDYHKISNESIHKLIAEILHYPLEHMHLSIITRRDPPLALHRLRMNSRLVDIRMEDLSFSEFEIKELFLKLHKIELSDTITNSLIEKTEGWITGICLAIMNINDLDKMESLPPKIGSDLFPFSGFLIEEVLSKLDKEFQNTLLSISVTDRFCAELVNAILKVDSVFKGNWDGNDFINQLVNLNLFVIPLDKENKWFRFHHLFQELLRNHLERSLNTTEMMLLHEQVSHWSESQKLYKDAIRHALEAKNLNRAVLIIEKYRTGELETDKWFNLENWLAMIPEEMHQKYSALLFSKAWILLMQTKIEELAATVQQLEELLGKIVIEDEVIGELAFLQGTILYFEGEGEKGLKYLSEARSKLPKKPGLITGEIDCMICLASQMCGEGEKAIKTTRQNIALANSSDSIFLTREYAGLGFIYLLAGDLLKGKEVVQQLHRIAEKTQSFYALSWSEYLAATISFHLFDLENALSTFKSAIEKRYISDMAISVNAFIGLALTYQALYNSKEANNTMTQLLEFVNEMNDSNFMLLAKSCQARLALLQGNLSEAVGWAKTAEITADPFSLFLWTDSPLVTQIRVLISEGSEENLAIAGPLLYQVLKIVKSLHFTNHLIDALILQAVLYEKQRQPEKALETMAEAIKIAAPRQFIHSFISPSGPIVNLLTKLKEKKIEVVFIEKIFELNEVNINHMNVRDESNVQKTPLSNFYKSDYKPLSHRQHEIVKLVSDGLSNNEIATKLFISESTVKKHLYIIFQNFEVKNRVVLIEKVKELGFLT